MGDDGSVGTTGLQFRSTWWTGLRAFAVMWGTFGLALLLFIALVGRSGVEPVTAYSFAVAGLWTVCGLALLALSARVPRTVHATPDGVHLDRGGVTSVPWEDLLRTQTGPIGFDVYDVWLETTRNQLVRLPHRVPAGTVESWRSELGGHPGSAGPEARRTWARAPLGPVGEAQLPQLVIWPFLLSGPLVGGESVWLLVAATAVVVTVAAVLLLRRVAPVRAGDDGVTLRRYGRTVSVPWSAITDVRPRKEHRAARVALVLDNGRYVPLPPGLTADVVQGWAEEQAPRQPRTS